MRPYRRTAAAGLWEHAAAAALTTGDWAALDGDALADIEHLACYRAWLAALRG